MTTALLYSRLAFSLVLVVFPIFVDVAHDQTVWIVALVLHLIVWSAATYTGKPLMETSESGLDEREVAIRNGASWWGLTTLCSLSVVLALLLIVAVGRDGSFFTGLFERSGYILVGMTLTSLSVPSVVAQIALFRNKVDAPLFVDMDDSALDADDDEFA